MWFHKPLATSLLRVSQKASLQVLVKSMFTYFGFCECHLLQSHVACYDYVPFGKFQRFSPQIMIFFKPPEFFISTSLVLYQKDDLSIPFLPLEIFLPEPSFSCPLPG